MTGNANKQIASAKSQAIGYLCAVAQAVLYSTMGIFGKLLNATGMGAQEVVVLRFLCTTVLLGAIMLVLRRGPFISRQRAVYVQAVFFFASAFTYFFAVERMNAGLVTVFFYTYPVMVAFINLFVNKEVISPTMAAALVLAVMGMVLCSGVIGGALVLDPVGLVFAIVSAAAFAVYTVLIQKTGRTEGSLTVAFTLSWTSLAAACVIFAPAVPAMLHLTPYQIGLGCTIALANTIAPIVIYIQAVKRIGGTRASLIGISETPFSLFFAFLLLGELIVPVEGAGIVMIVVSVVLVTVAPMKRTDG